MMGLKYLAEDRGTWTVRLLWFIAYLMIMWMLWIFVPLICINSFDTHITVKNQLENIPTDYIKYPGIALCNVNRISLRKARMLATDMHNANISNMTVDEILDAIKDLGYLYKSNFKMGSSKLEKSRLLPMFYGDNYDITEIMLYLTPECSRLLITCSLYNKTRNCTDMFSVKLTQDGFCCTFNYFGYGEDNVTFEVVKDVSLPQSFIVTLNPMLDDYFFSMMPVIGVKVMIFNPFDYPDTSNGGVLEVIVSPQTNRYVGLEMISMSSSSSIRSFAPYERKCIFADEWTLTHKAYTNVGNCIFACRLSDLWEYCKCRPFFYPNIGVELYNRTCTLEDVPCLDKYTATRYDIVPFHTPELQHLINKNSTLHCEVCYPPCDDITYAHRIASIRTPKNPLYSDINLTGNANYSILYVYFYKSRTLSLRQVAGYMWYQYLSDIGGVCQLFLGCSIVSVVELVYFFILCLTDLLTSDSDPEANEEVENQQVQPPIKVIYWNELHPSSRFTKPLKRIRKRSKNS